jgi:uncharacterized protein YegJ (DUF2314 family)
MSTLAVILAIVAGVLAVLWLRYRSPRPDFPPLEVGNDHPQIAAAIALARRRLSEFQHHATESPNQCLVKFALVTSSGATEHVWAEVVEVAWPSLRVRLVTPPVSHEGKLDRLHDKTAADIEDWQVTLPDGRALGGFTQRAMFSIAREQWGSLPPELEADEKRYQ